MTDKKIRPVLIHTIICDDVRQEIGGKFSLMGIFESISAPSFPVIHPRFAVWNEWSGGRGEFTAQIRLLSPDRKTVLSESASRFTLYHENQRHRDITLRFNTTFSAPGTYWIEMLIDGKEVASVPLPVQQVSRDIVH